MEIDKMKAIIEAILFASGRPVEIKELISALELPEEDIIQIIESMKADFQEANRRFDKGRWEQCIRQTF